MQGSPRKRGKMRQAPRGTQQRQKDSVAGVKSSSPMKRRKPALMEEEDEEDSTPAPLRAMLERQNTLRDLLAQDPDAGPTPMILVEGEDKHNCDEESLGDASVAFHRRKSVEEMQLLAMLDTDGLLFESDEDDSEPSFGFDEDPSSSGQQAKRRPSSTKCNNTAIMILRAMDKRKNASISNIANNLGNSSFNFLQAIDGTLENLHASTATSMRLEGQTTTEEKKEQEQEPEPTIPVDSPDDLAMAMEHPKRIGRRSSHVEQDTHQSRNSRSRDHGRSRSGDVVKQVVRERSRCQQARLKSKGELSLSEHTDPANGESPVVENRDHLKKLEHADRSNGDLQRESSNAADEARILSAPKMWRTPHCFPSKSAVVAPNAEEASSRPSRSRNMGDSSESETQHGSPSPSRRHRSRSSDQMQQLNKDGSAHSGTSSKHRSRSKEDQQRSEGCASPRKSRRRSSDSMVQPHQQSPLRRSSHHSSSRKSEDRTSPSRRSRSSEKIPPSERISSPRRKSSDATPSPERTSSPRRRSSKANSSSERISSPRRSKRSDASSSKEGTSSSRRSRSSEKTQPSERISSPRRSSRRSSEAKQSTSSRSHKRSESEHTRRPSSRTHSRSKEKSSHRKRSKSQSRADGRSTGLELATSPSTSKPLFAPMLRRAKSLSDVFAFVGRSVEGPSIEKQAKTTEETPKDNGEKKFQRLMVKFSSMRNLLSNDN